VTVEVRDFPIASANAPMVAPGLAFIAAASRSSHWSGASRVPVPALRMLSGALRRFRGTDARSFRGFLLEGDAAWQQCGGES
jgi:hypothetical protein